MNSKFRILIYLAALAFIFNACQDDDPVVVACFDYTPEQGIKIGDTVHFVNCSQEALEFSWSFGDSETSTEVSPSHVYTTPGTYTVTLLAMNGGITETVTMEVNVAKEVVACFEVSPEEPFSVGDTVYFTNCSEEATDYNWNFGDNTTSTEAETYHIYTEPGDFDVTLTATKGDDENIATQSISVVSTKSYIINYGSYSGGKSTITAYDNFTGEEENNFYKTVNNLDMVSNVQYAYNYNSKTYMLGNNADQIFWVDSKTFEQNQNPITEEIIKPRYCVGDGNYLYVSCWGGDIWSDENLSYIAKVNLDTKSVEKKIALPGGPEGLAIANNKLYAALNYKDSVAVIDLNSEGISYIETPAVTSYFVKDNSDNLYVTLVSTYSDFSSEDGIGYINTSTDQLEANYILNGVSTSYASVLAPNDDFTKLYVMTSAYDENYNLSGAIAVFDVASEAFETEKFVEGVSGLNGVAFNDDKVFAFISESATSKGKAKIYSENGAKLDEFETGIAPFMLLTEN